MRISQAVSILGLSAALAACGGASKTLDLTGGSDGLCGLTCGVVDIAAGTDSRGNPVANTGNTTSLKPASADSTLVLEKSTIVNLETGTPALSKLATSGKTATYQLDPNTDDQADWPKSKEYDLYLTQSSALGGSGKYHEYHLLSRSTAGVAIDEELQVWNWRHSYGVQYRHLQDSSGEALHQAWSFGGTRTAAAAIPTSGSATYTGRYGATGKTSNWEDTPEPGQTIARNNIWRISGSSATTVNFANGAVKSTLTPQIWNAKQTLGGAKGFANVVLGTGSKNEFSFMNDKVILSGTLSASKTSNAITGTANLSPSSGAVNGKNTNLFRGALFGASADEFTGIFNLEATYPEPTGGTVPINDDGRGLVNQSGVVNGVK